MIIILCILLTTPQYCYTSFIEEDEFTAEDIAIANIVLGSLCIGTGIFSAFVSFNAAKKSGDYNKLANMYYGLSKTAYWEIDRIFYYNLYKENLDLSERKQIESVVFLSGSLIILIAGSLFVTKGIIALNKLSQEKNKKSSILKYYFCYNKFGIAYEF